MSKDIRHTERRNIRGLLVSTYDISFGGGVQTGIISAVFWGRRQRGSRNATAKAAPLISRYCQQDRPQDVPLDQGEFTIDDGKDVLRRWNWQSGEEHVYVFGHVPGGFGSLIHGGGRWLM
jgi:hypothetical protein